MQKWEYLEVSVAYRHWVDSMGRSGELSQQAHSHAGFYSAASLLNELGQQGWEVTGVAAGNSSTFTLLLKRPMP